MEVLGLPLEKIRWNPMRNVALRLKDFENDAWKKMSLPINSFWRLCLKRLEIFGMTEGVYSLPPASDKKFHQTMEEKEKLIEAGILN